MVASGKSVRVILQNSTMELLTVESAELLVGKWSQGMALSLGQVVQPQNATRWRAESLTLDASVGGFVRIGSTKGYIEIDFYQPFDGRFKGQVNTPPLLEATWKDESELPDHPVMMVVLSPAGIEAQTQPKTTHTQTYRLVAVKEG